MGEVKPFYQVVWLVTKACGCPILRTKHRYDAVTLAADGHHILDAIACHSPDQEARELGGATGCGCGNL